MHPWSTERAKIAAESEISPPISPRQRAVAGGPQGSEYLEPLQEPFSSNSAGHLGHDNHPNSPYTHQSQHQHQHYQRRQSRTNSSSINTTIEPVSAAQLLMSYSRPSSPSSTYSSSDSASDTSSASSSFTSLSSVSSVSSVSCVSLSTLPSAAHPSHSLKKLETEKTSNLFLPDTPPSSHVPSPSSPSYPTLAGLLPAELQPIAPFSIPRSKSTRAPYHCTKKSFPQIVREISDLVDGRDKTIKVIQYFAKVFLWLFLSDAKQYAVLASRIKALAKQFSTTRKVLRLGHFVEPMVTTLTIASALRTKLRGRGLRQTLNKAPSQTWRNTIRDRLGRLNNVLGFIQDISDDICCLSTIGVLDRSFSDKAEPWSCRLWMAGVTIDLHENLQTIRDVRKQIKSLEHTMMQRDSDQEKDDEERKALSAQYTKLTTKLHWLQVTTVKLTGDFLFCGYDYLHCSFSDGFQAVTGLISGIAGAYKFVGKVMES
ncbi:Peroxisomal membrane protein PMP27 [Haplosporangium sp. Z 767]|nr:Peroxisomal membrane protein PMP27 [Haplosporangium sp. Z 11]KAF9189771.1 Peroxisomal membrane protein PMP27 [Haplosporangium sp. Z 767]